MTPALRSVLFGRVSLALLDRFQRADTAAGSLGRAETGQAWSLYGGYAGGYPLPSSPYGQITNNTFVDPEGAIVYASVSLDNIVKHFEVEFSWVDDTVGTDFTTLTIGISSSTNLIDNMLHITFTNGVCNIQKRVAGGSFVTMNTGSTTISPSLALAGIRHRATVDIIGDTCRVRVGKFDVTVRDTDIPNIIGQYVFIEHYSATTAVRWPLSIYRVGAAYRPIA